MKSVVSRLTMICMAFFFFFLFFSTGAYADNATVSIGKTTGTKGETIAVPVTLNADVRANGQISVQYDTNFMDFVSITYTNAEGNPVEDKGSGVSGIAMWNTPELTPGQAMTVNFNFSLKTAGSTEIKIADSTQLKAMDETNPENVELNLTKANATMNIEETTTKSGDSKLSGMVVSSVSINGQTSNVSFSPAFSPDIFEYAADVPANINRIIVSTTLSDAHASAAVSGSRIDLGNNKTVITVTAQNGTQSIYTIYTQRLPEGANQTDVNTTPNGEVVTNTSGEAPVETFDRSPVLVENLGKYIIQDFSLTTIPEGFEESTTSYNGRTVAALKGSSKGITVICLADDPQGTNIDFYIYNETSGTINKMVNISSNQKVYTMIPTDDTYAGPEGYMQSAIEVNGDVVKAWVKNDGSDFYIVYAMNWNGEATLYVYDAKEQTMQRFIDGTKSGTVADEPTENKQYLLLKKEYDKLNAQNNQVKDKHKVTLILLLAVIVVFAIVLFVLLKSKTKKQPSAYKDFESKQQTENEEEIQTVAPQTVAPQTEMTKETPNTVKTVADPRFEQEETNKESVSNLAQNIWNEQDMSTQDLKMVQEKVNQLNAEVKTPQDNDSDIEFVDIDDN